VICIDITYYKPSRKAAKGRHPTNVVLAVTNYDHCTGKYWLIAEIDRKPARIEKYIPISYMIFETEKGYHFYTKISHENPLKVIRIGLKLGFDKGQLRLGIKRYRIMNDKSYAFLLLRITPKYDKEKETFKPIYIANELPLWHQQVLSLLRRIWNF
jgi:hypothetical protein